MKHFLKEKEIFTFYAGKWLINERELIGLQVSNHIWKKPGREKITPVLIKRLVKKLEVEGPFVPEGRKDDKEFFKLEPAWDQGKSYKLIWYLKDNDNYIWIRTCYPTKKKYKNGHEK
ncbi:MAG: hypothetical protein MRERV_14c027 [Mycoplasmataceae bacterium RV_VA103A]|nr:MAG: hypothetical protein MRERV_14c027 [Mycoplasmataceae bacterium RV_VA103A]